MERDQVSRDRRDSRKRSRSIDRGKEDEHGAKRHRSQSPKHSHKHHHSERSQRTRLPFNSHHLHKNDFESHKALFAEYLDLQKGLDIDQLDDRELKGRWKSFLNKWNRVELAEGWYDPVTKEKTDSRSAAEFNPETSKRSRGDRVVAKQRHQGISNDDEDDDYGPALPSGEATRKLGPAVPNFQDLQQRREQQQEDREARIADLRYERKQDRNIQKERLDEIAPRADPGSRERQLEKKKEVAMTNRTFAEAKESGTEEVPESDLLGDDGVDAYEAKMRAMERQKNERELRKEEVLRARAAEREEKLAEHRRKEAKTMDYLKTIAQQRFGSGS